MSIEKYCLDTCVLQNFFYDFLCYLYIGGDADRADLINGCNRSEIFTILQKTFSDDKIKEKVKKLLNNKESRNIIFDKFQKNLIKQKGEKQKDFSQVVNIWVKSIKNSKEIMQLINEDNKEMYTVLKTYKPGNFDVDVEVFSLIKGLLPIWTQKLTKKNKDICASENYLRLCNGIYRQISYYLLELDLVESLRAGKNEITINPEVARESAAKLGYSYIVSLFGDIIKVYDASHTTFKDLKILKIKGLINKDKPFKIDRVKRDEEALSEIYRGKIGFNEIIASNQSDEKVLPMKNHINSLGHYGDSIVMAEATLTSRFLITGDSDFIGEHGEIRNGIKYVNKKMFKGKSNSIIEPIIVEEFKK